MSKHLNAVIIGSGIAGLASAIRLAVQGFDVTVFEKNNYPGGKLSDFDLNGFHFDAGPSLFVQPQNIEELFKLAGENISDYFSYSTVPVSCKYFYEDGIELTAWADAEKFAQELAVKVGEDSNRVKAYFNQSSKLFNNVGSVFLNHSLQKRRSIFRSNIRRAITSVRPKYLFSTMNEVNVSAFNKPHAVQLFNRYATYNGSDPYKAPAMLCLMSHLEYNEGTFYPKGGMISITNALYNLALKKGVKFHFNTPVQRIIYNDGRVKGVVANNENVYTNVVVSNADVMETYKSLLNDEIAASRLLKKERSSSAIVFYWGINKNFPQLDLHNIFFSKNYKQEFESIFKHKKLHDESTVYINITSKRESDKAPEGKENWFVMVNTPANYGQNWDELKQQCKANVIAKLNRMLQTDIEPLIEAEETLDPVSLETKTGAFMGAIYGASSNTKKSAFLRHPNFSRHISGLYFVGGTVHPGGGIPLCLKGAKIMSELVADDIKHFNH
jgi:phytoene desaturase